MFACYKKCISKSYDVLDQVLFYKLPNNEGGSHIKLNDICRNNYVHNTSLYENFPHLNNDIEVKWPNMVLGTFGISAGNPAAATPISSVSSSHSCSSSNYTHLLFVSMISPCIYTAKCTWLFAKSCWFLSPCLVHLFLVCDLYFHARKMETNINQGFKTNHKSVVCLGALDNVNLNIFDFEGEFPFG